MIPNGCNYKICKEELGKNPSRQDHRRFELWGCWAFSETIQPGTWLIEKLGARKGWHFPLRVCLANCSPLLSLRSWVSCIMLCLCLESLSFNGDCLVFGSHHFSCILSSPQGIKRILISHILPVIRHFYIYSLHWSQREPYRTLKRSQGNYSYLWLCKAQQVSTPGSRAQKTCHIVDAQKMSVE